MSCHKGADCPICSSGRSFSFQRWGHEFSVCLRCRFVYVSGAISPKGLGTDLYADIAYHKGYLEYDPSEIVDSLRLICAHKGQGQNIFCDVGCSVGNVLIEAQKFGFDVFGVEVSKAAALVASQRTGARIVADDILSVKNADLPKVDIFYLNHVLEHLPNPAEILLKLHSLHSPDGLIWVNVPNLYGFQRNLLALLGNPRSHAIGEHCSFFSVGAIMKLLALAGYKVIAHKKIFFDITGLSAPVNILSRVFGVPDSFAVVARRLK